MGSHRSPTTINTLPDNVFVEIFSFCRMDEVAHVAKSYRPWKWQRLAHVCRTWRHIMFASSRRLRLELLCTYGTPVKKNMDGLPAFPIVVSFQVLGRHFPRLNRDNLFAALMEHRDHVRVIEVDVPMLLHFKSNPGADIPPLPDTFLGGSAPSLQMICISGIPFPAAPILLASARDLVDLDLSDIPQTGYIPPKTMVTCLGALPRLKYLTYGFEKYGISYYPDRMRPLSITRTVLPALTIFHFNGLFEYFEDLVAQIDTPQLVCLGVKYLDQLEVPVFQIPQLCDFIDRSEKLPLRHAGDAELLIRPSDTVVIELVQGVQLSFRLIVQQNAMEQVVNQFSAILSNVDRLFINSESVMEDDDLDYGIRWRILLALEEITEDRVAELLPALELLCLEDQPVEYMDDFVAARQNVGLPVTVVDEEEFDERLGMLDVGE